jgi:hypothetical protein
VFEVRVGLRGFSVEHVHERAWCFVPERSFCDDHVNTVILRRGRNIVIIKQCSPHGTVEWNQRFIVNNAVSIGQAERIVGRRIARMRLQETTTVGASRIRVEGEVRYFRPTVVKGNAVRPPSPRDREVAQRAEAKTLTERHEAERRDPKQRGEKAEAIEQRQKKEKAELEKRHAQQAQEPPKRIKPTPKQAPREPQGKPEQPKEQPKQPPKERPVPPKKETPPPKRETPPPKKETPPPPRKEEPVPPKKETPPPPRKETPPKKEKPPKKNDGEEEEG